METIKCKATVVKQVYHNGNFYIWGICPNEFPSPLLLNKYGSASLIGDLGFLEEGKDYEFVLKDNGDTKYGHQYSVIDVPSMQLEDITNLSDEEKFAILKECTTSDRIAHNILKAYPDFINLVVTKGKEAIDTSKIHGVGEAYLNAYSRSLIEKYKYFGFTHAEDIKKYNFTVSDAKKLFDEFGDIDTIKQNLKNNIYYVMIEVLEHSFDSSDKMILDMFPNLKDSDIRCEALIMEVLRRNEIDGSSRLNGTDLYHVVKDEYNCNELIPKLKDVAVNSSLIYFDEKTGDLSIMATYIAECNVAQFIKERMEHSKQLDIDWTKYTHNDDGFDMTEQQSQALKNFCNYNISILCGYSGSGKSTSIQGLVKLMEDNDITYTLLAPTGKAGRVLSEATHRPASTIHRACYSGDINTDALIVDESSMINLEVMNMLINAITNDDIRVVFVLDNAQLTPIGVGKVISDLIDTNIVPKTMLTQIFRYTDNGSLFVATNVRQGKDFFEDPMVKHKDNTYSVSSNYKFIETDDNEIFDEVIRQYRKLIHNGVKQDDILVMCPYNVSPIGNYKICNAIQAEFNPPIPNELIQKRTIGKTTIVFRNNDIVVNKKNNYHIPTQEGYEELMDGNGILQEEDVDTSIVLNGQMGRIVQVVPSGLLIKFDEEILYFSKANLKNLLLGYSISTHSAQGSSAQYTIAVVSNMCRKMLSKELIYVADTRCRKAHIDIGQQDAFLYALGHSDNYERNTWLKTLLLKNN